MTISDLILKFKKRYDCFSAKKKRIETHYMRVVTSSIRETQFNYYGHHFYARLKGSSDYDAVKQVLVDGEYAISASYLSLLKTTPKIIIDAGANIGSTSIFFKHKFPESNIFCIEPDEDNYTMLLRNLKPFLDDSTIGVYKAGLMGQPDINLQVTSDFGDQREWARQVEVSTAETSLKSITIPEIISENGLTHIDLLKIDIEGGEKFLLDEDTDLAFLEITKCIALEVHDEYKIREQLYDVLINNHFMLIEDNQTTIAFNKRF